MKNKDTASKIFSLVSQNGGSAGSCAFSQNEDKEISVRNGVLESSTVNRERGLHLTVWFGQKVATVSGNDFSENGIERLVHRACTMARANQEDPFALLAEKSLWPNNIPELVSRLDLCDSRDLTLAEMKDFALSMEKAGLSVSGVSNSNSARVQQEKSSFALYTTEGFEGSYEETSYGAMVGVIAGDGDTMSSWSEGDSVRHFSLLRAPIEMGRIAGEMAVAFQGASSMESGAMPVVFDRYVSSTLLGSLANAVNGGLVFKKASFLKDKMGQQIFPTDINVVIDPFIPKLFGSEPFDGEGVAGARIELISKGVLTSWLTGLRSAAKLGIVPTGSSGNMYMENGKVSRDELIASIDRGLLVMEFLGQGVNIATGDYSRGVSGFLIEKGKITRPIHEVTVAGNLSDMFAKIIHANDSVIGRFDAPTLRINGMMVAGK